MLTEQEIKDSMSKCNQNPGNIKLVELTDTIDFNCKQCGKCCMNRNDIILNPFDIYNIAKKKNIEPKDALLKYCTIHVGANSKLPIVMLESDDRKMCPLLEYSISNGTFECSVNDGKPGACALHPIGIVRSLDKKTQKKEVQYISVTACNVHGTDKTVMVKDFIKGYLDSQEEHEAGNWLMDEVRSCINLDKLFQAVIESNSIYTEENCTEQEQIYINLIPKEIKGILNHIYVVTILESMYDFDTSVGFMEQLDGVKNNIEEACFKIITVLAGMNINIATEEFLEKNKERLDNEILEIMNGFKSFMDQTGGK